MKKILLMSMSLLFLIACDKESTVVPEALENRAPESVDLISPVEGAEIDVHQVRFEWKAASDHENDKVTYDLYVYEEGAEPVRIVQNLTETSYILEDRSVFNSKFKWYVVANDGVQRETVVKSLERNFTTRDLQVIQMHSSDSQMLFPERSSYTGVYFKNNFLVMNGLSDRALADVWASSNYGQEWSLRNDLSLSIPDFRRHSHTNVILNDKLYILGGYNNDQPVGSIYSSVNGADWVEENFVGSFVPRYDHSSVVLNDKILVIGGHDGTLLRDDVLSWTGNPQDSWVEEASGEYTPFEGIRGHSSVVMDNKVWILGGTDQQGNYLNTVWVSSDGQNWTSSKGMPVMSAHHKSVVFDNKIWVIGGLNESGSLDQIYYYDMRTKVWNSYEMPSQFRGLHNHAVIAVDERTSNDGIYILGSLDGMNHVKDVWKLH